MQFSIFVFVAMFVCEDIYTYVCMQAHVRDCSQEQSILIFEPGFLSGMWCSPIRLDWLGNKPQESTCLYLPRVGSTSMLSFLYEFCTPNLGIGNTLTPESFPQLWSTHFCASSLVTKSSPNSSHRTSRLMGHFLYICSWVSHKSWLESTREVNWMVLICLVS